MYEVFVYSLTMPVLLILDQVPTTFEDYGWRCTCHTLHLAVTDTIKRSPTITKLLQEVTHIMDIVKNSSKLRFVI